MRKSRRAWTPPPTGYARALDEALRDRLAGPVDLVLLLAAGAGFSSGAVLLRL
jgi:3-oxoacyl-[acyl-carrier-protein] synthase III